MSRNVSAAARAAMYAQQTAEVFLPIVELHHPDLPEPLRFVHNTENISHQGNIYFATSFDFQLPPDAEGQARTARLSIDNVDRQIVETIRSISTPPTIVANVVLASDPETVEVGPFEFTLRNTTFDKAVVSGDLESADNGEISVPELSYAPYDFPGLYA